MSQDKVQTCQFRMDAPSMVTVGSSTKAMPMKPVVSSQTNAKTLRYSLESISESLFRDLGGQAAIRGST